MSTASQLQRSTIGDWEILNGLSDPDREVYSAKRSSDGVMGLLVIVQADSRIDELLQSEVARCQQLDHPAIARVLDSFTDGDGRRVIAFEHIEGTSLLRLMKYFAEKNEGLGDRAILHIGARLVEALAVAHQGRDAQGKVRPMIHGQLGPHQVLLSWEGTVKVMGLGLAAAFGGVDDEPDWLHVYIAPEVRDGGPMSARANVYTAGAMLWQLFSRDRLPADGARPAPLRRTRPDLPASITFPIDRAMEPANKRISAKALAVSLGRTLDDADREELRWAMEVCRVRVTLNEEILPQESFPRRRVRSVRAMSSMPPDSDRPTARLNQNKLLDEARLMGPLPWEKGSPDTEGTNLIHREPGQDTKQDTSKRRIPRPSKARRSVERRRRNRAMSATNPGLGPAGAEDAPPVELIGGGAGDAHAGDSLAAPTGDSTIEGDPMTVRAAAEAGQGPSSGHIVNAGYQPMGRLPSLPSTGYPASPSYHHPASQYPSSQYPQGLPGPNSGVPLSYAPNGSPGYTFHSQAPPGVYATSPPTKWIVAVAVTAVASFAFGLLIAGISGMQVQIGQSAVAASSPPQPAPPPPSPVVATAEPTPVAETPEPEPEPRPEPEPEEPEPVVDENADSNVPPIDDAILAQAKQDARKLRVDVGILLIRTTQPDAWVYVSGRPYSRAGVPFQVVCGPHHIRLGDANRSIWHDPGQSITIACQSLTDLTILPQPTPPNIRRMAWPPRKRQFLQ